MEVCVENIQSAINAASAGASRIELCASLLEEGLTPSIGILKTIKKLIQIPVFVMLRPRRGNFVYTKQEMDILKQDAVDLKQAGADGFVFGILKEDGTINEAACKEVLNITRPLPATFHRAFDYIRDPIRGLEILIKLGFDRVLTSGQRVQAEDGLQLIKRLVEISAGRIIVMPGSGVNGGNIRRIMETGVREVHGSARSVVLLKFQSNTEVARYGKIIDDNHLMVTDVNIVRAIVSVVNEFVANK